jgi:ABC-2 type transport system ATP-binding protein
LTETDPLLAARGVARRFGAHVALEPSAGRVECRDGTKVGWAPQRPAQYGRLTARENLRLFARLDGQSEQDAEGLLAEFELPADRPADTLSVGQRQRLNLALAFLGGPRVVLLDEPTAALDEASRRALWHRVEDLIVAGGAVAFASQDLGEVQERGDRVVSLEGGKVVASR